jgi:hypothetical protein
MGSLCAVLKEWHAVGIYHLLKEWQTLITGVFGLAAGVVAYIGAIRAANRQVRAAQQAAADQVAAMRRTTAEQVNAVRLAAQDQVDAVERQLVDTREARRVSDQRRYSVIQWAVKVEGRRLGEAARARKAVLPSSSQQSDLARAQLIIEGSPLLRGEHADLALLDQAVWEDLLAPLADALDAYNTHIETLTELPVQLTMGGTKPAILIDADALRLLDELAEKAESVAAVYKEPEGARSP